MTSSFKEYLRSWSLERSKVKEVEGHLYFSVGVIGDVLTTCRCRDQEAHRIAPLELQQ